MPLQIVSDEKEFSVGKFIPRVTLLKMLQNFVDNTYKKKGDKVNKVDKDKDSHAVWYSKQEIDLLFAANSNSGDTTKELGLRIYFAIHTDSKLEQDTLPLRDPSYINQHTGILICTRGKKGNIEELLADHDSISIHQDAAVSSTGYEEGHICPPPNCGKLSSGLTA